MPSPTEFPQLAKSLKHLLKERGITYRILAAKLGISESSMKKAFIGKDCSLARINRICEVLGIGLADLLAEGEARHPQKIQFTEKQEKYLTQDRRAFQVYWKLVYEELTLPEIRRALGLGEAALFKILRALDQHALIELQPGGRVKAPEMSMVLWTGAGPLLRMSRQEWAPLIMRRAGERSDQPGYGVGLRYFNLTEQSRKEFITALDEIFNEFGRRSLREKALRRAEVKPLVFACAFSPSTLVEEL